MMMILINQWEYHRLTWAATAGHVDESEADPQTSRRRTALWSRGHNSRECWTAAEISGSCSEYSATVNNYCHDLHIVSSLQLLPNFNLDILNNDNNLYSTTILWLDSTYFLACTLAVHSAIHRHQPPQRTVLSQVDCFIQCEVVSSQISLDSVQPRNVRAPWKSPPVLRWGSR